MDSRKCMVCSLTPQERAGTTCSFVDSRSRDRYEAARYATGWLARTCTYVFQLNDTSGKKSTLAHEHSRWKIAWKEILLTTCGDAATAHQFTSTGKQDAEERGSGRYVRLWIRVVK
jgi:hypothetical protein